MRRPIMAVRSWTVLVAAAILAGGCASRASVDDLQTTVAALREAQDRERQAAEAEKARALSEGDSLRQQVAALTEQVAALRAEQQEVSKQVAKLAERQAAAAAAAPRRSGPDPDQVYAVPVGDSPVRGPAHAAVTIIQFTDFQCPFCKRAQETLAAIRKHYGDDVRIVFKHNPLPFHERAMPAAVAAVCAQAQGKFWEMQDLLWAGDGRPDDATLEGYARKLQLSAKSWQRCREQDASKRIKQDQDLAVQFNSRGTPTFFINGRVLTGAQPFDKFQALIDEELKKAKSSSTAPAQYYKVEVEGHGLAKAE